MKALIPAAGHGTQFLPVTRAVPKEMLPVGSKPAIQLIVEEALDAGADINNFETELRRQNIELTALLPVFSRG